MLHLGIVSVSVAKFPAKNNNKGLSTGLKSRMHLLLIFSSYPACERASDASYYSRAAEQACTRNYNKGISEKI